MDGNEDFQNHSFDDGTGDRNDSLPPPPPPPPLVRQNAVPVLNHIHNIYDVKRGNRRRGRYVLHHITDFEYTKGRNVDNRYQEWCVVTIDKVTNHIVREHVVRIPF